MSQRSKKAVIAALFGNLGIAIFKIAAALLSGSSSMLAEGYHSISDTFNQVLLLYGLKRSKKPPDREHPFGHGKEQFFWSFMVAVVLFGIAGTLSILEGYHRFQHPEPLSHIGLNYLAIGVAVFFESFSFRLAVKNIKEEMRREEHSSFWKTLRRSKDPTTLTVFVEDALALSGLFVAGIAIGVAYFTHLFIIDAYASVVIGSLLMVFSLFLAFETKKLLVGEAVTRSKRRKILKVVRSFNGVDKILSLKTMHLSSDEVLVNLELDYKDGMVVSYLENLNEAIEQKIKEIIPQAKVYLAARKRKT